MSIDMICALSGKAKDNTAGDCLKNLEWRKTGAPAFLKRALREMPRPAWDVKD